MKAAPLVLLVLALQGCALVFQHRDGKKCFPRWAHACKSLLDRDR